MDQGKKDKGMQAVIIADSFKNSFGFIQNKSPTCLMPCVNTPLLAYTIEFLVYNNIKQLIIFAYDHKKAISDFIDSLTTVDISIKLIRCSERPSVTSAIKDLDGMDLIKNDFLLINGHIITNIDISKAIEEHNKRKAEDKPMLMTKLFMRCPLDDKIRNSQDLITLVTNNENKQIMKYESMSGRKRCKVNQHFEFKQSKHTSLDVRMDLLDCDIDIVSQSIIGVLEDFANFEQFKDDFINHVIESDIITDKVFMHEVRGNAYFSRVNNYQVYFQSCMDSIHRESYPICPGANIDTKSLVENQNIIMSQQESVQFKGMNEKLGSFSIGENTVVGSYTTIEDSCIGSGNNIGENCEITESIVWNDVKLGNNCIIKNCVITDGVEIKPDSELTNVLIIDQNGEQKHHPIEFNYRKQLVDQKGEESEESDLIEEESDEEEKGDGNNMFDEEVRAIVMRQINEGHPIESIKVEINTVRFSDNKTLSDCLVAIVPALIDSVLSHKELSVQASVKALDKIFSEYSELLKSFIVTINEQACLIECIEKC